MEFNDILGWAATVILLLTILAQIRKQIKTRSGEGVSNFLFIGQFIASFGLAIYSYNLENWTFTFLNAVMLILNCIGFYFTHKFKKEQGEASI